jgi:hypothetical protein
VNTGKEQYLQALADLRETTRSQAERVAGLLAKQGEGHCCICAESVVDEYQSGGCRHAEGRKNSSKLPIEHVT